jgi:putative acetyltransferase
MYTIPKPFRTLLPKDNEGLAQIIRSSIEELKLPLEGTAHSDPTTDNLFSLFQQPGSGYLVLELEGKLMGGCGIFPSSGLPNQHAELVRFFLHADARGKGYGKLLMQACEKMALELGYTHLYLESFPDMEAAIHLYEKFGYQRLSQSLGNTGHFSCNVWMLKQLVS